MMVPDWSAMTAATGKKFLGETARPSRSLCPLPCDGGARLDYNAGKMDKISKYPSVPSN